MALLNISPVILLTKRRMQQLVALPKETKIWMLLALLMGSDLYFCYFSFFHMLCPYCNDTFHSLIHTPFYFTCVFLLKLLFFRSTY